MPLEKLTEGTIRISQGIFNKPVTLKSGDEFENLADSFNAMAARLDDKIRTIKLFAEIDRLILSTLDTDYIIETLIMHLHGIFNASRVGIVTIGDVTAGTGTLTINTGAEIEKLEKKNIRLNSDELRELNLCDTYLLFNNKEHRSYLDPAELDETSFLVFPVHIKGQLSGLFLFASTARFDIPEDKLEKLDELGRRVAVAFSNAAWEEKLYNQAHYDGLTGLPNRFLLRDRAGLAMEYAGRTGMHMAILSVDIDDFKRINDSLGHAFGDEVLKQFGRYYPVVYAVMTR